MPSDDLVTDPTEPVQDVDEAIYISDFQLVSSWWAKALEKVSQAAEIMGFAWEVGKDVAVPPAGGAGTIASTCQVNVIVNSDNVTTVVKHEEAPGGVHKTEVTIGPRTSPGMRVTIGKIRVFTRPAGYRRDTDSQSTDAPDTDSPDTDAPDPEAPDTDSPDTDAPDTDAPDTECPDTESPDTDAPDALDEVEGGHYTQPDPSQPSGQPNSAYENILTDLNTMTFSDARAAEAYLAYRMREGGLVIEPAEDGLRVAEKLADPARVGARLVSRGVRDQALIRQAITQTNDALLGIEAFVKSAQTSLAGAKAIVDSGHEFNSSAADHIRLGSVFEFLAPSWAGYAPVGFTTRLTPAPGDADSSELERLVGRFPGRRIDGDDLAPSEPAPAAPEHRAGRFPMPRIDGDSLTPSEPAPAVLMALEYRSSLGVLVQAIVATEIVASSTALESASGIYVGPFVSVFDTASLWTLTA